MNKSAFADLFFLLINFYFISYKKYGKIEKK